jgi:hypothetical protein
MVDVTLLRKLADKSKFGYGKYQTLSVRDVLNLGHPNYIRWCYFYSDKISFLDSILDEVKIPKEYRIEKPGRNPELGDKLEEEIMSNARDKDEYYRMRQKQREINLMAEIHRDRVSYSKGNMERINHGHRK